MSGLQYGALTTGPSFRSFVTYFPQVYEVSILPSFLPARLQYCALNEIRLKSAQPSLLCTGVSGTPCCGHTLFYIAIFEQLLHILPTDLYSREFKLNLSSTPRGLHSSPEAKDCTAHTITFSDCCMVQGWVKSPGSLGLLTVVHWLGMLLQFVNHTSAVCLCKATIHYSVRHVSTEASDSGSSVALVDIASRSNAFPCWDFNYLRWLGASGQAKQMLLLHLCPAKSWRPFAATYRFSCRYL